MLCPALAASPARDVFLSMAADMTARDFFGKQYSFAVAYRACHLFDVSGAGKTGLEGTLDQIGGGAGVASMSEGGMSVSFAQHSAADAASADLSSTKYGRMLLSLIQTRPAMGVNQAGILQ
jgi:hypothetical protein